MIFSIGMLEQVQPFADRVFAHSETSGLQGVVQAKLTHEKIPFPLCIVTS